METYSQCDMEKVGINITFVQDNQSMSPKGVLRRLHFQKQYPQTKLVLVIKGGVLTEENKKQFLIPKGFVYGFLTLSETAEFCYKCDDFYHANDGWLGMILRLTLNDHR